jgi:hypothetical protein
MQKLYERLKGRKDVQVVTLNVDDNTGLVAPFMKEHEYTFPVIPAQFLVHELLPSVGIPLNWIVDAAGVVRLEKVGFGAEEADSWVEQAVQALDKTRAGTN